MRFGEKVVVFVLRPIYRTFFERLIWWYLTKIKAFFMAETGAQVSQILRRLESLESNLQQQKQHWMEIETRLRSAEANNAAQWNGIGELLLALFRQPESRGIDKEWKVPEAREIPGSTDLNRVHAASSIR